MNRRGFFGFLAVAPIAAKAVVESGVPSTVAATKRYFPYIGETSGTIGAHTHSMTFTPGPAGEFNTEHFGALSP